MVRQEVLLPDAPEWVAQLITDTGVRRIVEAHPFSRWLGEGGYKLVYASGDRAVALTEHAVQLKKEHNCLDRMRPFVPTVEILDAFYGWNAAAAVMPLLNAIGGWEPILSDMKVIAKTLLDHDMEPQDLQVMLNNDGKPVLMDPFSIDPVIDHCIRFYAPGTWSMFREVLILP